MKDMGPATHCVGLRITQSDGCIELNQSSYIQEILERFGMDKSHPIATPSDPNVKLKIWVEETKKNSKRFHINQRLEVYCI